MEMVLQAFSPLRKRPQLLVMAVLNALVMAGVGLVAPILSVYASSFATSTTMAGMIITLFGIGRLVVNLPAGMLAQRFTHRPLLIAGPAILVVGSIGAALAQDFTLLLICRFVQGIGSGIYMTVSAAAMASYAAPEERGRVMALYQGGIFVGAGLGPAIGGSLAHHFGLTAPFWAYAAVCAIALIVACVSVDAPEKDNDEEKAGPDDPGASFGTRELFRDPLFLLICIVTFGVFFTRTASQWLIIPLIAHDRYGLGVDVIGLSLTLLAISNFLTLPITGALVDRYGARRLTIISTLVMAASLMVIAFGNSVAWLWAGMALLGLGGGLNGPATGAYAAGAVPRKLYGPAMGLMRTWGDAGFVLGPVLIGLLGDMASAGPAGGLVANAFLLAVSGLAFAFVRARRR